MPQAAMLAIPILMSAAGAVTGIMAGQQQKAQADQQAQMQRVMAQNQRTEATLRSDDIKRKANIVAGRQAAMAGVGGVNISGSIVDNLAETQAGAARDIFNVNWSADARADNMEASAANLEAQGQQALTNSYIGAGLKMASTLGGSLLQGFGNDGVMVSQKTAQEKWYQSLDRNPSLMQGGVV